MKPVHKSIWCSFAFSMSWFIACVGDLSLKNLLWNLPVLLVVVHLVLSWVCFEEFLWRFCTHVKGGLLVYYSSWCPPYSPSCAIKWSLLLSLIVVFVFLQVFGFNNFASWVIVSLPSSQSMYLVISSFSSVLLLPSLLDVWYAVVLSFLVIRSFPPASELLTACKLYSSW